VRSANILSIRVPASTIADLEKSINKIDALNNSKIEGTVKNYLLNAL